MAKLESSKEVGHSPTVVRGNRAEQEAEAFGMKTAQERELKEWAAWFARMSTVVERPRAVIRGSDSRGLNPIFRMSQLGRQRSSPR